MNSNVTQRVSLDKKKVFYSLEWGGEAGQRMSIGLFTYIKPKNNIEKNHNKEALMILEMKRSQMIPDGQAINSGDIPRHKIKNNFLDYYAHFVKLNSLVDYRHLSHPFYKRIHGLGNYLPIRISYSIPDPAE